MSALRAPAWRIAKSASRSRARWNVLSWAISIHELNTSLAPRIRKALAALVRSTFSCRRRAA